MSHVIWHCGGAGTLNGYTETGPQWQHYWRMTCGYKLSANLPPDKREKLERKVVQHVDNMADIAMDFWSAHLPAPPQLHPDVLFAGEYRGFALGPKGPVITLEPFPVYSDFLITYSFWSIGVTHAQASYLENALNIERYRAYSAVYKATGGEIHSYSEPYAPLAVEVAGEPEHA